MSFALSLFNICPKIPILPCSKSPQKAQTRMRLFIFLFFISVGCFSQAITGKVVGIMDGDTVKLLIADTTLVSVRLANIDCPERKQPFSARAAAFTSQAVFGKNVLLRIQSKDRYGRYVANVIYNDSLSLSHELVKNGLAWHYIKFSKDKSLRQLENKARRDRLGLWQDSDPIAPWAWRDLEAENRAKSTMQTKAPVTKPTKKARAIQCTAVTKSGKRCKRMTHNSNGRCYQH